MNITGRYEIIDQIREGGMGEVFLGIDTFTGMVVAIKVSKADDPRNIERFKRESEILKQLEHKNIVKFFDAGQWNDSQYIVMDYIAGKQIGSEQIEAKALIRQLIEVADALSYLHSKGVVHRDVKPSNILVSNGHATLVDFGIAKVQNKETISKSGTILGTLQYMAPEQVFGQEVDERADVYSLGVVMYELFSGRPPFVSQNPVELIFKILSERPVDPEKINPNIPDELRNIILKALDKDPVNRYQTMPQLMEDLYSFVNGSLEKQSRFLNVSPLYAPFVGRLKEIVQFDIMLDNLPLHGKQVMTITGKQGIGKSRLLEEFRSIALSKPIRFLICDPGAVAPGKPAIASILDQLAGYNISIDKVLASNYAFHIRELSSGFADKNNLPTNRRPLDYIASLPDVVAQLIVRAFKGIPFVIGFEDKLDEFSVKVLTIISRMKTQHLGIVAISDPEKPYPFNAQYRIELGPLSRDDLENLSMSVLGSKMTRDDLDIFQQKTNGHPLYALSILRQMLSQSTTVTLAALPLDIARLYEKKVSRLSAEAKSCLLKMALLAKPLPVDQLRFFFDFTEFEMFKVTSELFKADLITEKLFGRELCLDVVSGILSDIIATSIAEQEKRRLHSELANSILHSIKNDSDPLLAEAGKHFMLAGEISEGSKMVIASCAILVSKKLFEASAKYLEYVFPSAKDLAPELSALFWLNYLRSLFGIGKVKEAYSLIEEVEPLLDHPSIPGNLKAELYKEFANTCISELQFEQVRDDCLKALFFTDSSTPNTLMSDIFHLLSAAEWNLGDFNMSLEYSEKEKDFAQRSGNKNKLVNALIMNGNAFIGLEKFDQAKESFQKAFTLAAEIEFVPGQLNAMNCLIEFDFKAEHFDEVVRKLREVMAKAKSVHDYSNYFSATMNLIMVLSSMGKLRNAYEVCEEILSFYDESGCNLQVVRIYDYMVKFSLYREDISNLEKYTKLMFEHAKKSGLLEFEISALLAIARLHMLKNDPDKAIMLLEKMINGKKYPQSPSIIEAYGGVCILSSMCEDYDRVVFWFKEFGRFLNNRGESDLYIDTCLYPKTQAFVLSMLLARNQDPNFYKDRFNLPVKDGKLDLQRILYTSKQACAVESRGMSIIDCYKPESVLGYISLLNVIHQKKLFMDKHLIRDGLKIVEDTVYEMFTHDFKYFKDGLLAVKFKLVTLLQN